MIERMLRDVDLPADANWAAAFVQHLGYWLHFDYEGRETSWPFPMSGSFDDMLRFASERGVVRDEPMVGDIALVCKRGSYPSNPTYEQGGFVAKVCGYGRLGKRGPFFYDCLTLEGNTDLYGAPDGQYVARVPRRIIAEVGDCFIHWVELDARGSSGMPSSTLEQIKRLGFPKAA